MLSTKIKLFVNLIFCLFSYVFSNIQTDQRFIFKKNSENLVGDINVKKIEFNKTNENTTEKTLEIIIEFGALNKKHQLFMRNEEYFSCRVLNIGFKEKIYKVENLTNEKKEIHFIEKFDDAYRRGFRCCLRLDGVNYVN